MTREEIIVLVGVVASRHPAFKSFVWAMRRKRYSDEETCCAWYAFREGWNAHDAEEYKHLASDG